VPSHSRQSVQAADEFFACISPYRHRLRVSVFLDLFNSNTDYCFVPMSEFKFTCPVCGQNILCDTVLEGTRLACPHCDSTIGVPTQFAGDADDSAGTTPPPPLQDDIAPTVQRTSGLAIASLVCSLSSLITCIGWLPGIICGHLAKSRIRRNPSLKGNRLATAGLVFGYLILVLQVGGITVWMWRVSSAVKQGFDNARQTLATNNFITLTTNFQAATNASPPTPTPADASPPVETAAAVAWTTNLNQMTFPAHPVSGRIHGVDFTLKTATLKTVNLKLNSENGLALEVLGLGKSPGGQSYAISQADDGDNPRVRITWNDGTTLQTVKFTTGYALKLDFSPAIGRKLSGKIYVCLPDDAESCLAGTFEVRLPQPK
jgi:hypothetical protein